MTITKETVDAVIEIMRANHNSNQDIEDNFKAALKQKLIDIDIYYMAMEKIYE